MNVIRPTYVLHDSETLSWAASLSSKIETEDDILKYFDECLRMDYSEKDARLMTEFYLKMRERGILIL